jgi:hypothetical protein
MESAIELTRAAIVCSTVGFGPPLPISYGSPHSPSFGLPRRGNFLTPIIMSAQPGLLKYANDDNNLSQLAAARIPTPYLFAQLTLPCYSPSSFSLT